MSKRKVSACIVVYGGAEEAARAARSVAEHTKSAELALYLVDNASPDGAGDVLRGMDLGPCVQVRCLEKNVGFGSGHNSVLPLLDSTYHAVINPDITLCEDAIGDLCDYLDAHPEAVMATPRLVFPDGREQYTAKRKPTFMALLARQVPLRCFRNIERRYLMLDEDLSKPHVVDFCSGCFFVIRTEVFRAIGGFDENYFMYVEDADITRKAQQCGEAVYVPGACVTHAWHRDANKKWKNFWMQVGSMFRYWRKWGFHFIRN